MSHDDYYVGRQPRNERSKAWAKRDNQPWTNDEDEFLISEWINVNPEDRDEIAVSQILERTIEACRVRCEHIRKRGSTKVTVTQTTTVTVVRTSGWMVGACSSCGNLGDVYSNGTTSLCENCR
jgi:hypothetical protein